MPSSARRTQLTLTIDERMQYVAERELKAGVEAKHARSGTAIVMNPYNGRDSGAGELSDLRSQSSRRSRATIRSARFDLGASVPFEPGSVFKVVTLTAALETTDLRPDTLVATGDGMLVLPGRVIHESHGGYGTITMAGSAGEIEQHRRDPDRHAGWAGRTCTSTRGASVSGRRRDCRCRPNRPGKLRPLSRWGTTSLASISMGQEVSVTSVQLARLGSVIANGGMLVKPRLILKRGDKPEPMEAPVRVHQTGNGDHDAADDGRRGPARHGPHARAGWTATRRRARRAPRRFSTRQRIITRTTTTLRFWVSRR